MTIEVIDLSLSYGDRKILSDVNFSLKSGDSLSILGANGSGKSTLLRAMLGFLKFSGKVLINSKNVCEFTRNELATIIAYVPQNHVLSYDYSVFDVAIMGALNRTALLANCSAKDKKLAEFALEKMGILHLKNEPYTRISGGERQLAFIARTLVQGAHTIFMDEPTNGLDFGNQIRLLSMINTLRDDGYTFILTTHHPRHARFASNLALLIKNGRILGFGDVNSLVNSENINLLYEIKYENFKDKL